jgi:hypothetical protein
MIYFTKQDLSGLGALGTPCFTYSPLSLSQSYASSSPQIKSIATAKIIKAKIINKIFLTCSFFRPVFYDFLARAAHPTFLDKSLLKCFFLSLRGGLTLVRPILSLHSELILNEVKEQAP